MKEGYCSITMAWSWEWQPHDTLGVAEVFAEVFEVV